MIERPRAGTPVSDLVALLARMQPVRTPGVFVFTSLDGAVVPAGLTPLATFREAEGLSLILDEAQAAGAGLAPLFRAAWITLAVHSDLQAVGLTAAVARALADAGISCNVVAAACHDHLFVPLEHADRAVQVLEALSAAHRA